MTKYSSRTQTFGNISVLLILFIIAMYMYQHNLLSYQQQTSVKKIPHKKLKSTWTERPVTQGIPKILHQVWSDEVIPTDFVDNIKKLVELNPPPQWKYYFWTLETGRKLIERNYPSLADYYNVSGNIQKADIIRLLAIHQFGGAYFDIDTVAVKPLAPYVDNHTCSITTEPPEHFIHRDSTIRPDFISNNVLLCKPRHPFYDALILQLGKQPHTCLASNQCTGPRFFSHVFAEFRKKKENFDVLPKLENYQLFQDKIATECMNNPKKVCDGDIYENTEIWRREMCDEWKMRGGSGRSLSKLAYTYHTWYHFVLHKNKPKDLKFVISKIVPHVIMYK